MHQTGIVVVHFRESMIHLLSKNIGKILNILYNALQIV